MRKMEGAMRWMVVGAAVLLGGCVNGIAQRQAELAPLVGQPESAVVQRLGVPSRTFETNGTRYLAYNEDRGFYEEGFGGSFGYGGFGGFRHGGFGYGGFAGGPNFITPRNCETTFAVSGGLVRSFDLRGNACG